MKIISESSAAKFIARKEQLLAYIVGLFYRSYLLTNKEHFIKKTRASQNLQDPVGDDAFIGLDA